MLDTVIDITGAEKGLILLDDATARRSSGQAGKPVIRASRQVNREAITDTTGAISDQHRPSGARERAPGHRLGRARTTSSARRSPSSRPPLERHVRALVAGARHRRALRRQRSRKGLFQGQLDLLSIFAGQASLISRTRCS